MGFLFGLFKAHLAKKAFSAARNPRNQQVAKAAFAKVRGK